MHPSKVPGNNKMPALFFKKYVVPELTEACLNILNNNGDFGC